MFLWINKILLDKSQTHIWLIVKVFTQSDFLFFLMSLFDFDCDLPTIKRIIIPLWALVILKYYVTLPFGPTT
jgi:hypothetical protein